MAMNKKMSKQSKDLPYKSKGGAGSAKASMGMEMSKGPGGAKEAKQGESYGKFSGKESAQKSEIIKGAKPKGPITDLHHKNGADDSGGPKSPVTAAQEMGSMHAYLEKDRAHVANGFRPAGTGSMDPADTERNPRKPAEGYSMVGEDEKD